MLAYSSARVISDSEGDASKEGIQKRKHNVHAYFRKNQKSRKSLESVSIQNFTEGGEEFTKVPTAVAEVKSYSYVQFMRKLASIVKNYHGIIELLHFINQRQAKLQDELYVV